MEIRTAVEVDWPLIEPLVTAVVRRGDTFTYDPGAATDRLRNLWLEAPPGQTVMARQDGHQPRRTRSTRRDGKLHGGRGCPGERRRTVPEAFRHPKHGLVGLHVMHKFL